MSLKLAADLMRANAIALALFALILFGAAFRGFDQPALWIIDLIDWPLDHALSDLDQYARWICAISAGLSVAFAAFSFLIVAPGVERGDDHIRTSALVAIGSWWIMDSAGSIATGFPLNALLNTAYLISFAGPLLLVRNENARPDGKG